MRMAKGANFTPICVSVTPERHERLRRLARQHDTSVSAIVNAALDDLFASQRRPDIKERLKKAPLRASRHLGSQ
jgi:predicted transcriptional regulator